jgi:outer membrane scaffolding protein for murein synthesis (MipA/OmpV family)
VTQLVGDAADSPIVDDAGSATQGIALLGLGYRF